MDNRREFGKWLQEKRLEAGYSQSQAAKILEFNTKGNVVGYENGMAPVPLERIFDIAKAYGIDIEDILDMLAEYEPNLYRRFKNLENRFFEHFFNKFKGKSRFAHRFQLSPHPGLHKQNYQDTGRRHHKPFLNEKGYLEVDHSIYYQTLLSLIKEALRESPPDILFPGITFFDRYGPRFVTDTSRYAHLTTNHVNPYQKDPSMHYITAVKAVQIH